MGTFPWIVALTKLSINIFLHLKQNKILQNLSEKTAQTTDRFGSMWLHGRGRVLHKTETWPLQGHRDLAYLLPLGLGVETCSTPFP